MKQSLPLNVGLKASSVLEKESSQPESSQREGSGGAVFLVTPSPLNYLLTHGHHITSVTPKGWRVKYLVTPV